MYSKKYKYLFIMVSCFLSLCLNASDASQEIKKGSQISSEANEQLDKNNGDSEGLINEKKNLLINYSNIEHIKQKINLQNAI